MSKSGKRASEAESEGAVALLEVLRGGPVGVSSTEEVEATRAALLPKLEQQIADLPLARARFRAERSRTLRLRSVGAALAIAAGVTLALILPQDRPLETAQQAGGPVSPSVKTDFGDWVTLMSGSLTGGGRTILTGEQVPASGRLATGDKGATLRGSVGYHLQLGAHSEVALPQETSENAADSVLRLEKGSAAFQVLPLPTGSTFSVVTHDARITVVGTAFSVETEPGRATCVKVTEGKVRVQNRGGDQLLTRGQSVGCEPGEEEPRAEPAKEDEANATASLTVAQKATTLAEQNKLLSKGLAAERQGNREAARRAYFALLQRYPDSAFAEDARAGLSRLGARDQPGK